MLDYFRSFQDTLASDPVIQFLVVDCGDDYIIHALAALANEENQ